MEIDELTPAELRIWRAFPRGESVNFRAADDEDPADGSSWGPERTVRATVLRALLLNGPQEDGEIPALKLAGARISGTLDLRYGTCDHAVRLSHCHFAGVPQLYGARLRQLNLSNSVLPGLTAGALRVEGVLRLSDCVVHGPVRLGGAQIANALFMERTHLTAQDASEPVLQLNQMTTGDDLWAPGLVLDGEMRLNGATIAGSINMNEARLDRPGRPVLDAETLTVEGDFRLRQSQVRGWIGLRGARIGGRLDLSHAHLVNPGDAALRASSCTIGELWVRRGPRMEGTLNLRRTQLEVLFLEPEKVPDTVLLNNLVYTTLTPHVPAEQRLPMLERDGDGYVPHAYEQLSASYLRIGDDRAARLVQLAKQRRHRRTLPWYGRIWGHVQDATVGYGFRPLRACGWLLSLLAIGSVAYGLHHPRPLKPSEAPDFNPVFYTLDLLLPVISFGQESAFAPRDGYQTLSYALVIAGWILATTVFAGVTRTVSRQ
ncbi:membrane-associated oxidoreductase [Streptomyces lincolnensis]|uniref:membrane-associated oxidoreductase n=1 Tax=Streptomyces lincolnensis TaxID=1915 RepID=UPI001E5AF0E2|nr:membrane-associated oxidoreductase [Streptomyces lincolnensis]MCD7436716.1 membrane-associated oxidoreductase [Streptomyces lincolnensis]